MSLISQQFTITGSLWSVCWKPMWLKQELFSVCSLRYITLNTESLDVWNDFPPAVKISKWTNLTICLFSSRILRRHYGMFSSWCSSLRFHPDLICSVWHKHCWVWKLVFFLYSLTFLRLMALQWQVTSDFYDRNKNMQVPEHALTPHTDLQFIQNSSSFPFTLFTTPVPREAVLESLWSSLFFCFNTKIVFLMKKKIVRVFLYSRWVYFQCILVMIWTSVKSILKKKSDWPFAC